ncbi:hypothetical protein [Roseateles sp.]|uniref:hypothetical protein n=1 Tax=Roseateles sp. TaxID=1971397 RepID=UPI0032636BB2
MDISAVRRDNVRALVKANGGNTAVAKRLGHQNGSFLSQQIGPNPIRDVTEKTARAIEEEFNLAAGSLDRPPESASAGLSLELVSAAIKLIGQVFEHESVNVQPAKFSEVVVMVLADSLEHGGMLREAHVRALARLLK